jgi:hypothetical protein
LPAADRKEFEELVLQYTDHRGSESLKKSISKEFQIAEVLVCRAAAMALFVINTTMLSKEDHLIVLRPTRATRSPILVVKILTKA